MSKQNPVVAVTGSSGAGTTTVRHAMEQIFRREGVKAMFVEGDAFHRYDRATMREKLAETAARGERLSHFGPEGNLWEELEGLFESFGRDGTGRYRHYVHDEEEAALHGVPPGHFTEWKDIPEGHDILFYEGLHGGVVTDKVDIARHVDLLIGVVPAINLEWIQKIHRDTVKRGYSREAVTDTILRRMYDYVHYIVPQFSRTDINFQRVPIVDTSNPFIARDVPTLGESMVVIRFRDPKKMQVDFPYLLTMLHGSFISRRNTIVVPGDRMGLAMELIIQPIIERLVFHCHNRVREHVGL